MTQGAPIDDRAQTWCARCGYRTRQPGLAARSGSRVDNRTDGQTWLGTIGEMGYGMSDTPRLVVPARTCLYARPGGPVVGVTTSTRERYAHTAPDDGGADVSRWRAVSVGTAWGVTWPSVRLSTRDPERAASPGCRVR